MPKARAAEALFYLAKLSEVEMLMQIAAGIEEGSAGGAHRLAAQVLGYRQFMAAATAKHRFFGKLLFWPDFRAAASYSLVAFETRIINAAAIEFDGDPVNF